MEDNWKQEFSFKPKTADSRQKQKRVAPGFVFAQRFPFLREDYGCRGVRH